MKLDRIDNSKRNIVSGTFLRVTQIAMPFVIRTVLLYVLGIQYLGLNSLFTSVIQVLNLAELGVGSAMVYSMYKPISEDNEDAICALMALYKKYYRIIGLVVLMLGLALLPFIEKLVKVDTVPKDINIYYIYLLNLGASVSSYWLFAYKNSILSAHQREDIINNITLIVSLILYVVQIGLLIVFRNYYYYVAAIIVAQITINIASAIWSNRLYPKYHPRGRLTKEQIGKINRHVKDLFTSRIGSIIVTSADTIVISTFLGLEVLAIYQNYYFIMHSIVGFIMVIFTACRAGIGNSLIVENKDKNFNDLKKFTFIIAWICSFCSVEFLAVYQPFVTIWTGAENLMSYSTVICLVIYFYVFELNQLFNLYKDSAGIWHKDRFRTLITALTNLALNLLSVKFWGLYGVILSTVVSTIMVGMPWILHNLFTTVFTLDRLKGYLLNLLKYTLVCVISSASIILVMHYICTGDILKIVIGTFLSLFIPNVLFYVCFRKTNEFQECKAIVNTMTKGKFKKVLERL